MIYDKILLEKKMELSKQCWVQEDIPQFQNYLQSQSKGEYKSLWEQKIVNTKLPCLAVPSQTIKQIVNQISKGNFLSFLDLWIWQYHANTTINGGLMCKIKDFDLQKKYLDKYITLADNWATIDCLKFKFTKDNKNQYFSYAKELVKSKYTFGRRLGLIICLKLCDDVQFTSEIFDIANSFALEQEYYVNMANAWLLAEMFAKHRDQTLQFLQNHNLNQFTINKMISKCRDSFRESQNDKDFLLKYKQK